MHLASPALREACRACPLSNPKPSRHASRLDAALDWSRAQLVRVTFLVAVCMTVMSFPICWLGARFLLTWPDVRGCWLFCLLSVAACALPTLLASLFRWARAKCL